jgi:hypothetical protein
VGRGGLWTHVPPFNKRLKQTAWASSHVWLSYLLLKREPLLPTFWFGPTLLHWRVGQFIIICHRRGSVIIYGQKRCVSFRPPRPRLRRLCTFGSVVSPAPLYSLLLTYLAMVASTAPGRPELALAAEASTDLPPTVSPCPLLPFPFPPLVILGSGIVRLSLAS